MNTKQLRAAFWRDHPELKRKPGATQNEYPTDTRLAWCDYIEAMRRDGVITDRVAQNATL
jgi:hypothetical protein